ncbi:MAG: mechanosensitive ion channel domain-containing protein [Geminicoccaceae bacterium]
MLKTGSGIASIVAAIFLWWGDASHPASAQDSSIQEPTASAPLEELRNPSEPLTLETINALVSRLSDTEVRALLLERLDAVAANNSQADGVDIAGSMHSLQGKADLIRTRYAGLIGAVTEVPSVFPRALESLRDNRPASFFFWLIAAFALMMLVGWLAEFLFNRATGRARQSIIDAEPQSLGSKVGLLSARLGLDLAGLLIFLAAAVATFFVFYQGHELTRVTVMTYVAAVGAVRLFNLFARFLLSPNVPALRVDRMSDEDARFLYRGSAAAASIAAFGFLTCSLLGLLGITGDVHELLLHLVSLAMILALIYTIWHARRGIRNNLVQDMGESRARRLFAEAWPYVVIGFLIVFFLIIVLIELGGGHVSYLAAFGTLFAVIFIPPIDAMIERAAYASVKEGQGGQIQAVILRALRIAIVVSAIIFVARVWEVDFHAIATDSVGARFAEALIDIGLVALVAYVLWEVSRIMIDRQIEAEGGGEQAEMGDEGGTGGSRLGTLLPLIKRTIQITIGVMAVMLVLSALGVNIGPLLAGAGVVGVAIGFGAQTLVRDIVSGIFFLVDDAFRVGEYVDVSVAKGTVEKISIRSFQLRHHRGALNTVPFGEIQTLTNYSRDWVVMKLEFRVPFDTDIAKVKKIFKQIGKDLLEHPEIGDDFLAPFKSQGVFSVDDSALIIRAKFTAKPGKQFLIKREAYQAVQRAFAENDIEFARKQVMVQIPEGNGDVPTEERKKIEHAAASALAAEPKLGPEAAQR